MNEQDEYPTAFLTTQTTVCLRRPPLRPDGVFSAESFPSLCFFANLRAINVQEEAPLSAFLLEDTTTATPCQHGPHLSVGCKVHAPWKCACAFVSKWTQHAVHLTEEVALRGGSSRAQRGFERGAKVTVVSAAPEAVASLSATLPCPWVAVDEVGRKVHFCANAEGFLAKPTWTTELSPVDSLASISQAAELPSATTDSFFAPTCVQCKYRGIALARCPDCGQWVCEGASCRSSCEVCLRNVCSRCVVSRRRGIDDSAVIVCFSCLE